LSQVLFWEVASLIVDHAIDEFLGLFAGKTLEYIRTPDEHSFCPPYNLIQVCLLRPLSPLLNRKTFHKLNYIVMNIVYFPSLVLIAFYESKVQSVHLAKCRLAGIADDDVSSGWDAERDFDPQESGWAARVKDTIPHIEEDEMFLLHRISSSVRAISQKLGVTPTVPASEMHLN
jgi:hypothetical protein